MMKQPLMTMSREYTPNLNKTMEEKATQAEVDGYLNFRLNLLYLACCTSMFMALGGCYAWSTGSRIVEPSSGDDLRAAQQMIIINMFVFLVVMMILRSDHLTRLANSASPKTGDRSSSISSQTGEPFVLRLTKSVRKCGQTVNMLVLVTSLLALLMPGSWILSLVGYRDVPVSESQHLPNTLNFAFGSGMVAYMISLSWLIISSMSRPVRATWLLRQHMADKIKWAEDDCEEKEKLDEHWQRLCADWVDLDKTLQGIWGFRKAGFLWCTVIVGSMILALVGAYNVIIGSGGGGAWTYVEAASKDPISPVMFIVGTGFASLMGLFLASTAFVMPFQFPEWFARCLPEYAGHLGTLTQAPTQAESMGVPTPIESKEENTAGQCILTAAMRKKTKASSAEHMRFIQCAQYVTLGAKLCGVPITKDLVVRLFMQIGVFLPTLLSVIHSVATPQHVEVVHFKNASFGFNVTGNQAFLQGGMVAFPDYQ